MNKTLKQCLERTIKHEFVSVYHDYDNQITEYTFPYNAMLTPRATKLMLMKAVGILDSDYDSDELETHEIDSAASYLLSYDTPEFAISSQHKINNLGKLITHFSIDFEGTVLSEKSYQTSKLNGKNQFVQLIKLCSNKIISQERVAQKHKMEKMFISMNMFNLNAQPGRK